METGRELDIVVAEKVMGWFWQNPFSQYAEVKLLVPPIGDKKRHWGGVYDNGIPDWLPNYSTNIADAWQVLEKLDSEFKVEIRSIDDSCEFVENKWTCSFKNKISAKVCRVYAETAPHAICLAALGAMGYQAKGEIE